MDKLRSSCCSTGLMVFVYLNLIGICNSSYVIYPKVTTLSLTWRNRYHTHGLLYCMRGHYLQEISIQITYKNSSVYNCPIHTLNNESDSSYNISDTDGSNSMAVKKDGWPICNFNTRCTLNLTETMDWISRICPVKCYWKWMHDNMCLSQINYNLLFDCVKYDAEECARRHSRYCHYRGRCFFKKSGSIGCQCDKISYGTHCEHPKQELDWNFENGSQPFFPLEVNASLPTDWKMTKGTKLHHEPDQEHVEEPSHISDSDKLLLTAAGGLALGVSVLIGASVGAYAYSSYRNRTQYLVTNSRLRCNIL